MQAEKLKEIKSNLGFKKDSWITKRNEKAAKKYEKKYFMTKRKIPTKKALLKLVLKNIWYIIGDLYRFNRLEYQVWKEDREPLNELS